MIRQAISISSVTVPSMGNCTTDQMIAMTRSVWRVWTRLVMKPTTTPEIANRKKNDEPSRPNCSGLSFSSAMIGWAARPDHHLVGEVDQHEQEEQGGHAPGAFEGARLVCHVLVPPARMRQEQCEIHK